MVKPGENGSERILLYCGDFWVHQLVYAKEMSSVLGAIFCVDQAKHNLNWCFNSRDRDLGITSLILQGGSLAIESSQVESNEVY